MPREFIRVKWVVDTTKLKKKLSKLEAGFDAASTKSLNKLGELGKTYAKSIAPRDTGVIVRNIHFRTVDGKRVTVFANDPFSVGSNGKKSIPYPGQRPRKKKFNLVRWMHMSPSAEHHIKTGDEKFMYSTFDYLRRLAPGIVESDFNQVILRSK